MCYCKLDCILNYDGHLMIKTNLSLNNKCSIYSILCKLLIFTSQFTCIAHRLGLHYSNHFLTPLPLCFLIIIEMTTSVRYQKLTVHLAQSKK